MSTPSDDRLSPHQRNRRIALAHYGSRPDYPGNDFQICIDPELRRQLTTELDAGVVRPSALRTGGHGSDRYLIALAKRDWPSGAAVIVYPDEPIPTCRFLRNQRHA